jgi:hypothetical protein
MTTLGTYLPEVDMENYRPETLIYKKDGIPFYIFLGMGPGKIELF